MQPQFSKSILPQISTLTKLRIALDSPPTADELVFLNTVFSLKDLSLSLQGYRHSQEVYPQPGGHLKKSHQVQGEPKIATLSLDGDPFFVFSAASFFASPSLHTFTAKIPASTLPNRLRLSLFLVSHILHLIAHYNPRPRQFSIIVDQPSEIEEASATWDRMESDDRVAIPDGFLPAIATLKDLRSLSLEHMPFLQADFLKSLLSRLSNSPCLQTLYLVPQLRPRVPSDLPNLDDLRTLSLKVPSLQHLTISLNLDSHPPNLPDLVIPGHGLRSLFITTQFTVGFLRNDVTRLVPLVKYLNRVFPQLVDVTSYHNGYGGLGLLAGPFAIWKDIDYFFKISEKTWRPSLDGIDTQRVR